ncbi:MAG: thioredoxin domain-containing protein [Candidatus Pacebacteria bacterium]|nr:thioredoxin domain-containing protein [Candidatus Paceibacterota bacterium]
MENKNYAGIGVALVVVVLLIIGAVVYGGGEKRDLFGGDGKPLLNLGGEEKTEVNIRPVSAADHIRGNINAPVIVVEYSDLECPFCKQFHNSMNQVMAAYGTSTQIAWVYRHFPLDNLHAKARGEAIATECAAKLGGNDGFWQYLDKVFAVTPSNDGLDASLLPTLAAEVGLNRAAFEACLAKNDFDAVVQADIDDATKNGATGTPFPVIISADGTQTALGGALPYPQLKALLEAELAKVK